jgi:hypothetical protein
MRKFIILSDLRIIPILASFSIFKFDKKNTTIIVSNDAIMSIDYGFIFPPLYNWFKIYILRAFCPVLVLETSFSENYKIIGKMGLMSSLVSITSDTFASELKYPKLYSKLFRTYLGAHSIVNYLNKFDDIIDIYVFNGRTAGSEPIVKHFWGTKVNLKFYEYSLIFGPRFTLYNFPVHNCYRYGKELLQFYENKKNYKFNFKKVDNYLENKLSNSFTKKYVDISNDEYDVCIFLNSDHELVNLNKEICENIVISNFELVVNAVEKYGSSKRYVVRAHPNQVKDPSWKEVLSPIVEFCEINNIKFYSPESNISSYSLINNSSLIVVSYSSIAEDAIFSNKKVDIMGSSDLKAILDNLPMETQINSVLLSNVISEILSLKNLFLHNELTSFEKMIFSVGYRMDILVSNIYQKYFVKYE